MTSGSARAQKAFVWIWLPGNIEPIVAGLNVAPVRLERAAKKDVLLIERFDRAKTPEGWIRRSMISALTLLRLDEMMGRYASYESLADIIRAEFHDASGTLRELFGRMVFNVLSGNTDDHARNHAALWDGVELRLSPAYDICPQPRTGQEASQAMFMIGDDRRSRIATCLDASHAFELNRDQARTIVAHQIRTIGAHWDGVCKLACLHETDRNHLWGRQFFNPYVFEDLIQKDDVKLVQLAARVVEAGA